MKIVNEIFFFFPDITQNSDEWKVEIENLRREIRQLRKPCTVCWDILSNYGHDVFIIKLLRDTTPHVECYDVIYGAKHPFLWP